MEKAICANCGNVYFRSRKDKVFCSTSCKSENWRSSKTGNTVNTTATNEIPKQTSRRQLRRIRNNQYLGNTGNNGFEIIGKKTSYLDDLREERKQAKDELYEALSSSFSKEELNKTLLFTGVGAAGGHILSNEKENKVKGAAIGAAAGFIASLLFGESKEEFERNRINKLFALEARVRELDSMITNIELGITHLQNTNQINDITPISVHSIKNEPTQKIQESISKEPIKVDFLPKTMTSQELANEQYETIDFGKYSASLGRPARGFQTLIYGAPGAGKSTYAIGLAGYIADNLGKVLYISSEEGFSSTIKDKLINNTNLPDTLVLSDCSDKNKLKMLINGNMSPYVFIDSINNMNISPNELEALKGELRAKNISMFCVCQSTKEGELRGSNEYIHNADTVLKLGLNKDGQREITSTKNRYEIIK